MADPKQAYWSSYIKGVDPTTGKPKPVDMIDGSITVGSSPGEPYTTAQIAALSWTDADVGRKVYDTSLNTSYVWDGGAFVLDQQWTSGAAHVYETGLIAGERNPGSATTSYLAAVPECNATVLDGTSAVAVSSGVDALVLGILIITSGTTATIVGLTDDLGAAKSAVLTSSAASQFFDLKGMKVGSTFTVTPSVDDDVVVFWRAQ